MAQRKHFRRLLGSYQKKAVLVLAHARTPVPCTSRICFYISQKHKSSGKFGEEWIFKLKIYFFFWIINKQTMPRNAKVGFIMRRKQFLAACNFTDFGWNIDVSPLRHPKIPKTFRIHPLIRAIRLFLARRRAAAKRKKLKNLGKSKSTDTEEEDADDDCGDDGELNDAIPRIGGSEVGLLVDRLAKNSLHLMVIS